MHGLLRQHKIRFTHKGFHAGCIGSCVGIVQELLHHHDGALAGIDGRVGNSFEYVTEGIVEGFGCLLDHFCILGQIKTRL